MVLFNERFTQLEDLLKNTIPCHERYSVLSKIHVSHIVEFQCYIQWHAHVIKKITCKLHVLKNAFIW